MADVYFKLTKIIDGEYWKVVDVKNVKPEEHGYLALMVQEYKVFSGDIGTSGKRVNEKLANVRAEMKQAGHVLHYDPPVIGESQALADYLTDR